MSDSAECHYQPHRPDPATIYRTGAQEPFPFSVSRMDAHTYPGRGLSLSQLFFALNEELKRVPYSPKCVAQGCFKLIEERHADHLCSFTLDVVSQLHRDISIPLATVYELKNSFALANRIPMDILSLIPTHLTSQKDRFSAASVCRHWRGVLLKRATLWSQLFLGNGADYASTLLERAKGSALDIIVDSKAPVGTIPLISPRAQQIRYLEFARGRWEDIIAFSEFNSGQLPLLRILKIQTYNFPGHPASPRLPLFGCSVNLEQFIFHYNGPSLLSHFIFPNLTTFELSSCPNEEDSALCLLNFLKASPKLQTVKMKITPKFVLGNVPQDMVVVLPNVETFSIHVDDDIVRHVYDIAAHISCPRAWYTSLTQETYDADTDSNLEIFPTPILWNTIVRQYVPNPIEEVALHIRRSGSEDMDSFLTFRSSDASVVRLAFGVNKTEEEEEEEESNMSLAAIGWEIFSQALTTIRGHPQLSHVKRLHIKYQAALWGIFEVLPMVINIQELFNSLGPLDELTIGGCDLHVFLANFVDHVKLDNLAEPFLFPRVKDLMILHPLMEAREMECMQGIVELAKAQHARGIPFERVTVRVWRLPRGMAEELERWVGVVDCREERYRRV